MSNQTPHEHRDGVYHDGTRIRDGPLDGGFPNPGSGHHYGSRSYPFEFLFRNVPLSDVVSIPFIDKNSVTSDDIFFMYDIYGIEVARQLMIQEIQSVLSFDGANIDPRCIKFIVDAMTYTGVVNSISRYTSVMTNALYEKEIKKFITYSLKSTKDMCRSVESSVFLGTPAKLGTNFFQLMCRDTQRLL